MTRLALDYLGTFRVTRNAQPITNFRSSNVQGLLVYLSLQSGRAIPRDLLATLFWPDEPEKIARANFRQSIYQLRKVLGDNKNEPEPILLVNRQTVTFNPACNYTLDVETFLEALAAESLAEGLTLYTGDLLPGFTCDSLEFEDWLRREREHLHQRAVGAAEKSVDERMAAGDYAAAQAAARRLVGLEPWHERGHRQLMRALALSGDRTGGLAAFARCEEVLLAELGAEPEEKTIVLAGQIEEGALVPPEPATSKPTLNKFKILSRLDPLPEQTLFGVETPIQAAIEALTARDRTWLVALDGIGGIGKSSLADRIVHHFLDEESPHFEDIAWVSAKQEEYVTGRGIQATGKPALDAESLIDQLLMQLADGPYPTNSYDAKRLALLEILNKKRSLVVIDNLETVADYMALLPILRVLSRPSKFLLTSRMSLHAESDVHCLSLTELPLADTLDFLKYEAARQRIPFFAALRAEDDSLYTSIYETVGGNPLALKLVLGQAHVLPLETILANIERAETASADQLYLYIYWQAWQMLDEDGRRLLLSLPVMPNGTFEQLTIASRLAPERCQQALIALRSLSLVEMGEVGEMGSAAAVSVRYRIHRLTETFLLHEVVKWQAGPGDGPPENRGLSPERIYFEERVTGMLDHWRAEPALAAVDVAELDQRERRHPQGDQLWARF